MSSCCATMVMGIVDVVTTSHHQFNSRRQVLSLSEIIHSLITFQDRLAEVSVAPKAFHWCKSSDISQLSGLRYMDIIPPTERNKLPATKCVLCNRRGLCKEARYISGTGLSKPVLCMVPCLQEQPITLRHTFSQIAEEQCID